MIKTKAIKKIFITTLITFILFIVYLIPTIEADNENILRTNLSIEHVNGIGTHHIYLMNEENLLVRSKILLDDEKEEQITTILEHLTVGKKTIFPIELRSVIPKNTKILNVEQKDNTVTINFSKEILLIEKELERQLIEAIVFSITELDGINEVIIYVENEVLKELPNSKELLPSVLTRDIGINRKVNITSRNDITKVVIYYIEDIGNSRHYVPVTRYLNDEREKIKVIITELTSSYIHESNLMSFFHQNVELINYEERDNILLLNFNEYLFNAEQEITEEVIGCLAHSVFSNYKHIDHIFIEVNEKQEKQISLSDFMSWK